MCVRRWAPHHYGLNCSLKRLRTPRFFDDTSAHSTTLLISERDPPLLGRHCIGYARARPPRAKSRVLCQEISIRQGQSSHQLLYLQAQFVIHQKLNHLWSAFLKKQGRIYGIRCVLAGTDSSFGKKMALLHGFNSCVTDGPTDGPTDGRTDGHTLL